MPKFTLTIDCSNAAFEGAPLAEVSCILTNLAHDLGEEMADVQKGRAGGQLRDVNGNLVGKWEYKP